MDAAERVKTALQAQARSVVDGLPEGRARQDALASWIDTTALTLGYETVTFVRWMEGKHAPSLQAYFDICDMFDGFERRVRPESTIGSDAYDDGYRVGVNDERERLISHLQDIRYNGGSTE